MISVCIASFNGEKYIKEQLNSILFQLDLNDEIIISDDGSTDNTLDIINSFNDNRIKVYNHEPNKELLKKKLGSYRLVAENFENALKHATGDYIFLSDQDDIWTNNRVKMMIDTLDKNIVVLCNYSIINDEGKKIKEFGYSEKEKPVKNSFIYNLIKCRFMCCCMAFKKELLKFILPFPKEIMSCDQWIGLSGSLLGNCSYVPEALHLYRRHGNNVSATTEKSPNTFIFKIYFRIYIMAKVLKRYILYRMHYFS